MCVISGWEYVGKRKDFFRDLQCGKFAGKIKPTRIFEKVNVGIFNYLQT